MHQSFETQSHCQANTVLSHTVQVQLLQDPQFVIVLVFNTYCSNSSDRMPKTFQLHLVQFSYPCEAHFLYSSRMHQHFDSSFSSLTSKYEIRIPHTSKTNLKHNLIVSQMQLLYDKQPLQIRLRMKTTEQRVRQLPGCNGTPQFVYTSHVYTVRVPSTTGHL
jgi:hypothetical protein